MWPFKKLEPLGEILDDHYNYLENLDFNKLSDEELDKVIAHLNWMGDWFEKMRGEEDGVSKE